MSDTLVTRPLDEGHITPSENKLTHLLTSGGIIGSAEEISNLELSIQEHPELLSAIIQDITAIQSNPSEKTRFETLYLKGFGQMVSYKDGNGVERKMSFAKLTQMKDGKEKDDIIDKISDEVFAKYEKYLDESKQMANQEAEKFAGKRQAANQLNEGWREKLTRMDGALKSQIEDLQKINGVPKPDIEELKKNAQNIPELQGANLEDIQSGQYNKILLADYYIRNAAEIGKKISPEDTKKFNDSIASLSETIGRQSFEKLLDKTVLGPDRQKIESRGKELIENGYNKEVIWNPSDRSITFTNKNGDIRVIETARIPPQESIVKNGLRISRDIEPVSPEEQKRKEKEKNLIEKRSKTKITEGSYSELLKTESHQKSYESLGTNDTIKQLVGEKQELNNKYSTLTKTNEKLDTVTDTIRKIEQINDERKKYPELLSDTKIENTLETERFILQDIQRSLTQELQAEQELPPVPTTKKLDTQFESAAAYNLNFLSYIGYDGLGQDGLERVIQRLNSSENPHKIETGTIDLNQKLDTPKTQALTLAIANLVRSGRQLGVKPSPEQAKQEKEQKTWDGVDKRDPIIAARQTQTFGFRESLLSVRRNMTQEGGSLKTRGQLDRALFGIETAPGVNN